MTLSRDQILSAQDRKFEEVDVPEWGGSVRIGVMSGALRDAWEQSLVGKSGPNILNIRARLVAFSAVDDEGKRLFSEADAEALGDKSATALDRCAKVSQKLNGLTEEDLEEAKGN